jgi:hypothetical protein
MEIATISKQSRNQIRELLDSVEVKNGETIEVRHRVLTNGTTEVILKNKGVKKSDSKEVNLEGSAFVEKKSKIKWKIKSNKIVKIKLERKENCDTNIWSNDNFDWVKDGWEGTVENDNDDTLEWIYTLHCELDDGTIKSIDPIIRVNK